MFLIVKIVETRHGTSLQGLFWGGYSAQFKIFLKSYSSGFSTYFFAPS